MAFLRALPAALLALSSLSVNPARPLVATRANETQPFGHRCTLVWTDARRELALLHLGLGDVRLRMADGRTTRVNPRGTLAAAGGLDGRLLVLSVVESGNSDLVLVDLATHRLRKPAGVDTPRWEWRGTLFEHRADAGRNARPLRPHRLLA